LIWALMIELALPALLRQRRGESSFQIGAAVGRRIFFPANRQIVEHLVVELAPPAGPCPGRIL
jgi:hypothetical protein